MANKAKDLASGTLSSSTSASSTSISVSCGSGSDLALLGVWPTTPFYITVMPANPSASVPNSLDSEIMKVSVLNASDGIVNMAVSRGQRGTTAKAFSAGDIVSHAVYAEDAVLLGEEVSPENPSPWVGTDEIEDEAITTGKVADGAITTGKIANNAITSGKIDWSTIDYSSPVQIGKWVNGKPLYRKVVNVAPLPNASFKNVAIGINAVHVVNLSGFAYQPSNNRTFMLPFLSDSPSTFITLLAQGDNVIINSYTADRSGFTTAYVYVDYWTD